ncbi:uncharacterized protein LOC124317848 [Daphnia pulicaria]|uniref:uncharacterized protein LOC124317848 n=1 Tax=Daphnia pulicaria TaxID=35523 RepID=UPI001EEA080F|nr:uncharacterized protein LOC124317848 [Daphnia pulicaria]
MDEALVDGFLALFPRLKGVLVWSKCSGNNVRMSPLPASSKRSQLMAKQTRKRVERVVQLTAVVQPFICSNHCILLDVPSKGNRIHHNCLLFVLDLLDRQSQPCLDFECSSLQVSNTLA